MRGKKKVPAAGNRTDKLVAAALNELRVTQGALSVLVEELTLMRAESIQHRRALVELGVVLPELVNECRKLVRTAGEAERGAWTLAGKLDNIKTPAPAEAVVTIEHAVTSQCPTCDRVDVYNAAGDLLDSTDWANNTGVGVQVPVDGFEDDGGELGDPPGQPVPPPREEVA